MIIEITDSVRLSEVQDAFRAAFPFLTIEFFAADHSFGSPSPLGLKLPADKTIGELRTTKGQASMEIHSWHTTGVVEQEFGKIFGLSIQIFRRDGSDWVQTAGTDARTLEEQNAAGRNAAQEFLDGTDAIFNSENPVNT